MTALRFSVLSPVTSSSLKKTLPVVGSCSPATSLSSVLFPHPLGPSRKKSSPAEMVRLIPSSATTEPNRLPMLTNPTDVISGPDSTATDRSRHVSGSPLTHRLVHLLQGPNRAHAHPKTPPRSDARPR